MSRREAIESLKAQLTKVMSDWIDSSCETPEWESINCYVGDETALCMANAAISVLDGIVDAAEYLKREGYLS